MDHAIIDIVQKVVKNVLNEQKQNEKINTYSQSTYDPRIHCAEIPVEISARHVHLSEADALALFGEPLTFARELSQPGQYLCNQRVRLVGPKGVLDNVAILGPDRKSSQIEISKTDARILGIDAPIRQSGDVQNSPGIILTSSKNLISLEQGVIVAARHIHMPPQEAERFGLRDNDIVIVRLNSERPVVFEDVRVRVDSSFNLSMHIDSDEGNSAAWTKGVVGCILGKK